MAVAPKAREAPPLVIATQPAPRPWNGIRFPKGIGVRIGLIAATALFLLPFYWMANSALKTVQELSAYPPTLWPHAPAWDNFYRAVTYIPFGTFLTN